jgi:hypothetical protein
MKVQSFCTRRISLKLHNSGLLQFLALNLLDNLLRISLDTAGKAFMSFFVVASAQEVYFKSKVFSDLLFSVGHIWFNAWLFRSFRLEHVLCRITCSTGFCCLFQLTGDKGLRV